MPSFCSNHHEPQSASKATPNGHVAQEAHPASSRTAAAIGRNMSRHLVRHAGFKSQASTAQAPQRPRSLRSSQGRAVWIAAWPPNHSAPHRHGHQYDAPPPPTPLPRVRMGRPRPAHPSPAWLRIGQFQYMTRRLPAPLPATPNLGFLFAVDVEVSFPQHFFLQTSDLVRVVPLISILRHLCLGWSHFFRLVPFASFNIFTTHSSPWPTSASRRT